MPVKTTNAYKLKLFLVFSIAYILFYVLPNFMLVGQATLLPMTWIDLAIPFIPWTFSIYTSDYTIFLFVILLIEDKMRFNAFARLMFGTLFICGLFFIFFPTTYPRPVYPDTVNPIIGFLMYLVSSGDTPNNCFPSMHVSLTCGATWAIRHKGRGYFLFFGLWSFLIIVSTLTTKQHYFVDILGGLFVTLIVCCIETYYIEPRLYKK